MKHIERTRCQQCVQRKLFTELSDLMMRRRGPGQTPTHRLSARMSQIAYPWRLYDMMIELARANVSVLVGAGDNLVEALITARRLAMAQAGAAAKQMESIRPVAHVSLRAPTWLHARVLLAAMIEIDGVEKHVASNHVERAKCGQSMLHCCQVEIGFSLAQLAESCDPIEYRHQMPAELFQSLGAQYVLLGKSNA